MVTTSKQTLKHVQFLAHALKAPRISEAAERLANQARDANWTHEEYLAAVLDREVAARTESGTRLRVRAAGFPATKTLTDFDFTYQSAAREPITALSSAAFLETGKNVVLLGPPGTGKTRLAVGLGHLAAAHGHRVLFATATEWVRRLAEPHNTGGLSQEFSRLRRYGLLIIDAVGYLPIEQEAANLMFQLVSWSASFGDGRVVLRRRRHWKCGTSACQSGTIRDCVRVELVGVFLGYVSFSALG